MIADTGPMIVQRACSQRAGESITLDRTQAVAKSTNNFARPNNSSTDARQPTCHIKRQTNKTIEIPYRLMGGLGEEVGSPLLHGNPSASCAFLRVVPSELQGDQPKERCLNRRGRP